MLTYSWDGHGNLGDDWLAEVRRNCLPATAVSERRALRLPVPWRYELRPSARDDVLVLWGGGWLAADQPRSTTVERWAHHLYRHRGNVCAFGIGIGPFHHLTSRGQRNLDLIVQRLSGRASVRTVRDVELSGDSFALGCDPALLDTRYDRTHSPVGGGRHVVSMPAWRSHWLVERPWMTELHYREAVRTQVEEHARGAETIFMEFDSGRGGTPDSEYWSFAGWRTIRPQSVSQAADILRTARSATLGRLHAAIMAGLVGTPAVAVAYHHKFAAVEEIGLPTAGIETPWNSTLAPGTADPSLIRLVRKRGTLILDQLVVAND